MEDFFARYKNPLVLMAVLVVQVIVLATQVKRPDPSRGSSGGPRLIRVWTVTAFAPLERVLVSTGHFFSRTWRSYIDLHDVRRQNRELQEQLDRMRLEEVRLKNDAEQSQRLQSLMDFRERFVGQTVPAQVIGTSGSDLSRVLTIDKGSRAGIRQDMAVITPDGIVGKVKEVFPLSSQVLMINDRDSGAGVILENSRLQGVLHGAGMGELRVADILSDEKVEIGERVITSGGDRVFPKGLPVGAVTAVGPDPDGSPFLAISLKPATALNRLEEVLVVTKIAEAAPVPLTADSQALHRASDVLAQRLPSVPKKPEANPTPSISGSPETSPPTTAATTTEGKSPATPQEDSAPSQNQGQQIDRADPANKKASVGVKTGEAEAQPSPALAKKPSTPQKNAAPSQNQAQQVEGVDPAKRKAAAVAVKTGDAQAQPSPPLAKKPATPQKNAPSGQNPGQQIDRVDPAKRRPAVPVKTGGAQAHPSPPPGVPTPRRTPTPDQATEKPPR
jgi:rod shape-determining protein MreC